MKSKSFKEALEKSIKMYDWIVEQPDGVWKSDYFNRRKLIPKAECYLCEWNIDGCLDCIKFKVWAGGKIQDPHHLLCFQKNSIYKKWVSNTTAANAAKVRDALIAALKRVESK